MNSETAESPVVAKAPPPSRRATIRQRGERAAYDRETVYGILDAGFLCHVGFIFQGQPIVIPTNYARRGDELILHGAVGSRMLRTLKDGAPLCVTITHLDGLVLARSAFHHSVNYRSVVIFGSAREITGTAAKTEALESLIEHIIPGRSAGARGPNATELRATRVLAMPIDEASAKIRRGPPIDDEADMTLPYWAGEIPLELIAGLPRPDPKLAPAIAPPSHVAAYRQGASGAGKS
jgi:nitroimidazol reductase NimA-like FMN-containing flavoprotein (pyridoxamine 5'-phosphate oxidase superfamily)